MNNRDWLYTMQPRDLARWFDAEHVEPNDDLPPEKGVSGPDGGSNAAYMAQDTRGQLLYDASELVADCAPSGGDCDPMYRAIVALLDRQAAITERECAECARGMGAYADSLCDPLKERIAELQAKVDELEAKCDTCHYKLDWKNCIAECSEWHDRCIRMRDAAREIERIAEVDE